jgi:hypothetical protein
VFRFLDVPWRVGFGLFALDHARPRRGHLGGGARQARSRRLTASRTVRSRGCRLGQSSAMGTANGSDPGRHRPMSAPHDSVFKTGNPSSRHTPLGVPTPRGGSRFTASEPASAFAAASHGGIVLPRSVSARTENASSPAGSPAERDESRPPASAAALPRRSALELGAAPRWSRPASPYRVNDTDPSMVRSIFSFRHMSLPYVRGALGARGSPIE